VSPNVGGIGDYSNPQGQGTVRGLGEVPLSPSALKGRIPDGALVEGLVLRENEGTYLVRVAGQLLQARSTIPLFPGQRFRAIYDASGDVPLLRLTREEMALISAFAGKERTLAAALLGRGLPISDDVLRSIRQGWAGQSWDSRSLGSLIELWARGAPLSGENVSLLSWYMELAPQEVASLWGEIRERLRAFRERNSGRPEELLKDLRSGSDDSARFLKAHALASRPAREGIDPASLLAPAWWPLGEEEGRPLLARVNASEAGREERRAWRVGFEMEGRSLGPVAGEILTDRRALTVDLMAERPEALRSLRAHLGELAAQLEEIALPLQHLAVGPIRPRRESPERRVDLEA